jgi:small subunit ribosomal protein S18
MGRAPRKKKPVDGFKKRKKKPCVFCIDQNTLDYKDIAHVKRFLTDRGKIAPRRLSGCCALHQRMIAKAIKRARLVGLVPYVVD